MKIPAWLDHAPTPPDNRLKYILQISRSWVCFAAHLKMLSADECLYVLRLEVQRPLPRPEFISRTFSRYFNDNRKNKWDELMHLVNNRGYRNCKGRKRNA